MNAKFLLLAVGIAGLTGCATSYKTGQTPDDVYFSPAPKYVEKEVVKEEENRQDNYYDYRDRATRMKTTNYRRWNSLDDPYYFDGYSYSPSYNFRYNYSYGYSYHYNPFAYNGNHYGYGGYCCCYNNTGYGYTPIRPSYHPGPNYAYVPAKPKYVAPRGGGTTGYGNNTYSNTNNNSKSGTGLGRVFNSSSNNSNSSSNNSSSSQPVRTYEPSSSSSNSGSSGSSSNSGGGTVTRPARNGN